MKKITLFFAALLVALSSFAANPTFSGKLYLTPHSAWKADNARFAAYFFTGDQNVWANMTRVETSDVYDVTVPEGSWETVIFCRMNPNNSNNGWDALWGGQTQNLAPVEGMDHFVVNSANDAWNKPAGEWKKYEPTVKPEEPTVKPIFSGVLYLTPHSAWTVDNARYAAYFFTGDKNIWVSMTQIASSGVHKVTVPDGSWETVIFCRMNPNNPDNSWDKGDGKPFFGGQTANLIPVEGKNHYIVDSSSDAWKGTKGEWGVYDSSVVPEVKGYVLGINSWDLVSDNEMTLVDGTYTKSLTLTAGNYVFKVNVDNTWYGFDAVDATTSTPGYVSDTKDKNIGFQLPIETEVVISFKDGKITLKAAALDKFGAMTPTAIVNANTVNVFVENRTIVANDDIEVFSITGKNVTNENGRLLNGIYIVKSANQISKVIVK